MSLLENIKKTLIDGGEKVVKAAEDITGKIREAGEHGWDISKEVLAEISEKTADITNIARYKLELKDLQKNIDAETINLGELAWAFYSAKNKEKSEKKIQAQIENIENLKRDLLDKTTKYEDLRKIYSQDFIVQKFSEELAENDAVMDQVIVKEKSQVLNKTLKEIILPKEALISAIKRNDQIIIPDGNTKILRDDLVTVIGRKKDVLTIVKKLN